MAARSERGQSLVEMALVLPIFLLLLISVFDLGHVVWANDALSNAAREAARYAIVHGGNANNTCPVGPPADTANIPPQSTNCPNPSPSKQSIKDTAIGWAGAASTNVTVYVCYSQVTDPAPDVMACDNASPGPLDDGDTDKTSGRTNARGNNVTVLVTADVGLAVPSFFGVRNISLSATSTMLVNH